MRTFAMTSRQMSYYYGQPLVHCYLLHAEWLAERANRHSGEASRFDEQLIRSTLGASRTAQHHLLELLDLRSATEDAEPESKPISSNHFRTPAKSVPEMTSN